MRLLLILLIPTFSFSMNKPSSPPLPLPKRVLISFAESMVCGTVSADLSKFSLVMQDYKEPQHISYIISYGKASETIQFMKAIHLITRTKLKECKAHSSHEHEKLQIYSTDSNKEKRSKIALRIEELQKAKKSETMLMAIAVDRFFQFLTNKDLYEQTQKDKNIKEN
jgi:hypothetical protein